jgi:histidyl-tRNA synthetase
MALSTQPYKGARDFYPEDKRTQKYMFGVLRNVVESFGYQEYDAPILEPIELYLSKTSEEIVSEETYSFTDRGGRHVVMRPEMTPSVSRMVAGRRQELAYPVRWYSIPNLWRYERPQHGRLREHWQLNVDIFGVSGIEADHEVILVADSILQAFGAQRDMYEIHINSRMLINWLLLDYLRLEHSQAVAIMRLIDKKNKLTPEAFATAADALLSPVQRENNVLDKLNELLAVKNVTELPMVTQQHPAVSQLIRLMELLTVSGVSNAVFDLGIMRGFDYYNNIVFEVFDTHEANNRSMFGGGRYDGLVGEFGVEPVPTVGFGMGDVTLKNFLEAHQLLPELPGETDAAVILVDDVYMGAQKMLAELRKEGVRVAVDTSGRKIDAQIKAAAKAGLKYALFIGPEEVENYRFKLKDLVSGEEHEHSLERVVSKLAARRAKKDDDLA